ncbi:hypothetical protein MNBD_IGNAVI01-428 [hydrothermal vent metagenome]|uniref:Long-chain fatty acid transport protein n=1 Tax=hydrothermal vent metagenome TaxID=652676 RepID=A0A3B1BV94_9ZZZZ
MLSGFSYAQDSQYWSKQYGTYGALLGGTVVGAVSDLSATYYNPGAMAFSKDSTLILTTNSFQFIYINFNNSAVTDLVLDSWYTNASRGIFAIRLPFKWLKDDQLVVSYIAKQDFNFYSTGYSITPYYSKNYNSDFLLLDLSLFESWYGITWSKPVSKNIGFGVTMYVPYRSQRVLRETLMQEYNEVDKTKDLTGVTDINYYNLRLLWKAGISAEYKNWMFGLSLTTPSINLFGSGDVAVILSKANNDTLSTVPNLTNNYQKGISAKYKSPLSIGFGAAYYWEKTVLYFSAEWFNNVSSYLIMNPDDFIGQSTEKKAQYNINYSLKSVFNYGFGIKYTLSKNFIYYGSISTDNTAYDNNNPNALTLSTWDIIHIGSGTQFNFKHLSITFGLSYGYSGNLFKNFNFLGLFKNETTDVIYHQIDVVFGFTYSL